jgi:hypothetical protein
MASPQLDTAARVMAPQLPLLSKTLRRLQLKTHSGQKQQDHPRLTQKEKAKGVLEILDSTPSSPTFTSKLPKSMQYRRDSGTRFEMGESSTQALIFAGKGKWTAVKSPY